MEIFKWNFTIHEARDVQTTLRKLFFFENRDLRYDVFAGADVAYFKKEKKCIALCVLYSPL